jgi:hypothetical protein
MTRFRFTIRDLVWLTVVALCAGVPSFFAGELWGLVRGDVIRGNADVARVKAILEAHPDRFRSLTINRGPLDKFLIQGTVKSQADLDFLRNELIRAFGEERVRYIFGVEVLTIQTTRQPNPPNP